MAEDTRTIRAGRDDALGALELVVFARDRVLTFPLRPDRLSVVGRGEGSDFLVDDPSVSRRHVAIQTGESLSVEDLGSRNGTRVGGRTLGPSERVEIGVGQSFEIGEVIAKIEPARTRDGGMAARSLGPASDTVVVACDATRRLHQLVSRVAVGDLSVLLLGETGVGKEVIAETIHRGSLRADKPFLRLNCAAFSETLLEAELFGYERGSFTGATQSKVGLLETASGGTVLLDEIGELSMNLQAKLLRAIEAREILRIGALKARPSDVRVISATNRDLAAEASAGRFRSDLYFRLNGVSIHVPPLRERREEIAPLAQVFLQRACARQGFAAARLSPEAIGTLQAHDWPGNLRELRNAIERAVLLCDHGLILPEHLPPELSGERESSPSVRLGPVSASGPEDERRRILDALEACAGNQSRAAERLGITRRMLVARLDRYDIARPRKGR